MASYLIDLENGAVNQPLLTAGSQTNGNGSAKDMNNSGSSLNAVLNVGTATGDATVKVQESDDQATWSDLGSFSITGGGVSSNSLQVKRLLRTKRYVRGSTSGVTAACNFSLTVHDQKNFSYGAGDSNSGVDRSPSS